MKQKKKVIVIGAGFAGLQVVKSLANQKEFEVVVIDKTNHHLFQPLLYQVATAVLSPADIAIPTRSITTQFKNVKLYMANVEKIDPNTKEVHFAGKKETFDYLIFAVGAQTSYFGNDEWKKFTFGLKNLKDALSIRRQILLSFEEAELSGEPAMIEQLLNYVVIGGGPTGVELAGSIAELSHNIIQKDFRVIDSAKTKVTLIEAGPRLLSNFHESLSTFTKDKLEQRGVDVLLNSPVKMINEEGVHLSDRKIKSKMVIWAAGVEAASITRSLPYEKDRSGRLVVDEFCRIKGETSIFSIGDAANFSFQLERALPGVSPVAMQQGRFVANFLKNEFYGIKQNPFKYFDKGNMATIGRTDAVAEFSIFRLKGFFGWLGWLFVHLVYQVGFKNKVSTLISWIWSYLTFRAGARLIQEEVKDT
jgi:NADH:ubiquinone reductase (H+-translocating)